MRRPAVRSFLSGLSRLQSCVSMLVPLLVATTALTILPADGQAQGEDAGSTADGAATQEAAADSLEADHSDDGDQRYYLVPGLEGAGYSVSKGKRQFKHRLSFSPAIGKLGSEDLFAFRLAYNPNNWLGYEIALEHNPASSLHALLHTFNLILRYPLPWRVQPYVSLGYGMLTVYPGQAIQADPVSKNTLTAGGGLELYLRDDVAIRGEIRSATVLGQELGREGTVALNYREYTFGFAFYRNLGR